MTTPELYPESPAGTLRTLTSPRAGLLQHPPSKAQINPGLSLSLDEKWGSRQRRSDRLQRVRRPRDFVMCHDCLDKAFVLLQSQQASTQQSLYFTLNRLQRIVR